MSARRKVRTFTTSLAGVSAEERELAARLGSGKRYPDRAALRGKVRRMTRQREALERRAGFVPRSSLERTILELGGELVSERVL